MVIKLMRSGSLALLIAIIAIMLAIPHAGHATLVESQFDAIDAYVAEQMDESRIPGVALSVVQDGEVVHARGFGRTSDDETVTPDTLFGIGSTGKSMTSLAIMQLSETGVIDLDAPVKQYIPWFTLHDEEMSSRLTVRHLLTMTSGIPATAGGEAFRSTEAMTPEAAIRTLQNAEFAHEPGTTFEYVNANYVILGHLVEVDSGASYGEYVQRNIFDPLGMNSTFTDPDKARQAGFAAGHRYWFGQPVSHEMEQLPSLVPAGYIISTAADLSNYLTMYLNEGTFNGQTILSPEGIAEMHSAGAVASLGPWASGATANYAMGWYVGGPWNDGSILFHPGSEPNFTAMLMIDQEREIGVVTLINIAIESPLPGAAGAMRVLPAGVVSILTGSEPGTVGLGRFYLIFNLIVLAIVAAQIVALVRFTIRATEPPAATTPGNTARLRVRRAIPLIWEFGLPLVMLILPTLFGMSWKSLMLWTPDLGLVVIVLAALWLLTGLIRMAQLLRLRSNLRRTRMHSQPSLAR